MEQGYTGMKLLCNKKDRKKLMDSKLLEAVDNGFIMRVPNCFGEIIVIPIELSNTSQQSMQFKSIAEPVEDWIQEYRSAFKHLRTKGIGVKQKCIDKMKEFMQENPSFTKEIILKARDAYIASFKGDYEFIEQADNFIKKRIVDPEEGFRYRSTLYTYCEEVIMREEDGVNPDLFKMDETNDLL